MIDLARVSIESFYRGNVFLFSIGPDADSLCLFNGSPASFQFGRCSGRPNRMIKTHGHTPLGHRAFGLTHCNGSKRLFCLFIPERMQQCGSAIEFLLCGGAARHYEVDVAKLFRSVVPVGMHFLAECR